MAQNLTRRGGTSLLSGPPNLTFKERAISVAGGLALAALATKPRPNMWLNLVALAAGSLLAYRGTTGYCGAKALMTER